MKKINQVIVKNFKILKNININLKELTLLTGTNSSGKSTLIQALLLIAQNKGMVSQFLTFEMLREKSQDKISRDNIEIFFGPSIINNIINLNGSLVNLGNEKDIFHQDSYEEDIIISFYSKERTVEFKIEPKTLNLKIKSNNCQIGLAWFNLLDSLQYLHTDRIQPQNTYELSNSAIKNSLLGIHGEYTAHYLDENRHKELNINSLKHSEAKTSQLLENVSLWLGEISKGIAVKAKTYKEIQKASLTFQYTYGKTTSNEYSPLNVGFGLTYVLPIIVAILKSTPTELIIIENPESHLHPQGQVKIAKLCALAAEAGVQIIIESHSDHFLNGLRVATKKQLIKSEKIQIHYFSKNHEKLAAEVSSLTIDKEGQINEDWPEGFFDEYGKQLDELLW